MSYLKQSVTIPLSPKNSSYPPDGFGRDSYIYYNNGGLCKSGQRVINSNEYPISINDIRSSPGYFNLI
jgi:hypothetical protein